MVTAGEDDNGRSLRLAQRMEGRLFSEVGVEAVDDRRQESRQVHSRCPVVGGGRHASWASRLEAALLQNDFSSRLLHDPGRNVPATPLWGARHGAADCVAAGPKHALYLGKPQDVWLPATARSATPRWCSPRQSAALHLRGGIDAPGGPPSRKRDPSGIVLFVLERTVKQVAGMRYHKPGDRAP